MNLKVYTPARLDAESNIVQEASERTLYGLLEVHIEFPRNVVTVIHRLNNGALVNESFELNRLFKDGIFPDFLVGSEGTVTVSEQPLEQPLSPIERIQQIQQQSSSQPLPTTL